MTMKHEKVEKLRRGKYRFLVLSHYTNTCAWFVKLHRLLILSQKLIHSLACNLQYGFLSVTFKRHPCTRSTYYMLMKVVAENVIDSQKECNISQSNGFLNTFCIIPEHVYRVIHFHDLIFRCLKMLLIFRWFKRFLMTQFLLWWKENVNAEFTRVKE